MTTPQFKLGSIAATPGALAAMERTQTSPKGLLQRHVTGDWGDLCEEDRQENELSIKEGFRIFSSYFLIDESKVWVITEADRSSTTILLPEEY